VASTHPQAGLVIIDITFSPEGRIIGMQLSSPSKDLSQGRLAWTSITSLNPVTGIAFAGKRTFRVSFCYS
jgi:hypothetical protein